VAIGFDGWLDDELQRGFASFEAAPLPAGAPYRGRRPASAGQWFAALLATRTVVVLVVAALGLTATSALAATAVTGTIDPQVWTRHIVNAISDCTTQVATGRGGLDTCAKAIVHHEGPKPHQQSHTGATQVLPAPTPNAHPSGRPDEGKKVGPSPPPKGPDANAPEGRPTNLPKGPPTAIPNGRPSDVPPGPPSGQGKPPKVQLVAHP
jgi:hypothetical protein